MAFYSDGELEPRKVSFHAFNGANLEMREDMNGNAIVSVGESQAVVPVQDLLNAARFLGAKDFDVKIETKFK